MTTHIKATDSGLEIIPPRDSLTQGSDNTLTLSFEFSGAWLECTEINAVFTDEINSATVPVTGGACVIPVEVLQNAWRFVSVALNGTSAGGIITSPFARIGQVLPSASGGDGGKFVTLAQLMDILQGYVKAEDLGVYITQEDLDEALLNVATAADIARLETDISGKADKTTVGALAATVAAQGADIATKASAASVSELAARVGTNETNITALQTGKADKTALEDYWSKAEIDLQTSGDGTKYLADDGTYKTVQGGGGGDEKTFVAEYNVTTAQEIIAYLDAAKEPFAPMLVKRGTDYYTVTTAAKQAADKVIIRTFATITGNYYMFQYTITGNSWSSSSHGFQKLLESGTNIKTINGQSLLGSGDIQIQGGGGAQVQANWNEADDTSPAYIQNKPAIPDVSGLATQASVDAVSARVGTNETNITALQTDKADKTALEALSATVAGNTAAIADKADKTALEALSATVAGNTAAIAANATAIADKADKTALDGLSGTVATNTAAIAANATAIAGKADKTALEALSATVAGNTAAIAANATAIAGKADKTALDDYATDAELAAARSALQADIDAKADESALADYWSKAEIDLQTAGTGTLFLANDGTYKAASGDPPDLSAYLTKTEAADTYATKTAVDGKADSATVTALSGAVTANTAEIATLKTGKADSTTVTALDNRVSENESAIATLQTQSADYATKTDISGVIKGIKWGSTSAQVDDDGVAEIGSFALQKTSSAVPGWNTSEWRYIQNIPGVGAEQGVLVAYTRYTEANTVRSLSIFGVRVPTYNEFTEATGNMATQAWVQEYIASLDGSNMQF